MAERSTAHYTQQVHSLELSLAPADDAWVRADWQALHDAGLPSRATAQSANNAPHITITGSAEAIPPDVQQLAQQMFAPLLPVHVGVGGTLLFGDDPVVVTRVVEAPHQLAATVFQFLTETQDMMAHVRSTWIPHITLARRSRCHKISDILTTLQPARGRQVQATGLWCWNPDTKIRHVLVPPRSSPGD